MRVMLVSRHFPPDEFGGVERYTQSLAVELAKCGDSVSIVARRSVRGSNGIQMLRERLPDGTPLYRLLAGKHNSARFLDGQQQVEQLFTTALIEWAPEVVHMNDLAGFSPRAIQLAHRLGAAVVVSLHDFYFACPIAHLQKPTGFGSECAAVCFADGSGDRVYWGLHAMWFQRALAMAERVIGHSQYLADCFRTMRTGVPIEVIENGILSKAVLDDSGKVHNSGACLTLAYCGAIAPHRSPHVILEAIRLASVEQVQLLLIGEMPEPSYAASLREKAAGIPGLKLQMYGRYSGSELRFLLRGTDCLIVLSLVPEAGPMVPREALESGIPVAVSNLGALPENIVESGNEFIFDPFQPAELAAILRRLANDVGLLPRLRAGAHRSTVTSTVTHAERIRAIHEEAVEDFRSRPEDRTGISEFEFLHHAIAERERELAQAFELNASQAASIGG